MSSKKNNDIESIDEAKELFYGLAEDRKQDKRALKEAAKEEKRLAKEAAKEEAKLQKSKSKHKDNDESSDSDSTLENDGSLTEDSEEETTDETEGKKKYRGRRKRKEKVNIVKELYYLAIYIGVVILACYLIVTFVGERTTVEGESMNPTLHNGESLWIDKITYRFSDPKRFDIVVFPPKDNPDELYIKRVIGLPGETVRIDEWGIIYINGKELKETYGLEVISPETRVVASNEVILGHDEYFVMGDNRNNSQDSRKSSIGNIKKKEIVGKAIFRLSPLSKFGKIK